jgi:ferredoxin
MQLRNFRETDRKRAGSLAVEEKEEKMDIDKTKCVGCGNCHLICTMGAISLDEDGKSVVNQDECVECATCHRVLKNEGYTPWFVRAIRKALFFFKLGHLADVDLCPTGALTPPELAWPRILRAQFSNPTVVHPGTGVPGRGTDEIKSNDVTGRLRQGEAGLVVEIGRPGLGAFFRDIEKVAMALAPLAPVFEPENPVTHLISEFKTGRSGKNPGVSSGAGKGAARDRHRDQRRRRLPLPPGRDHPP